MQLRVDNKALLLCLLAIALSVSLCAAAYASGRAVIVGLCSAVRGGNCGVRRAVGPEISLMTRVIFAFCAILLSIAGCVGYIASLPQMYARKRARTR